MYSELHYLLGLVTLYRGNPSAARQLLAESLSLCINNQEEVRAARVCTYLADAVLWESRPDEAEQWQITLYAVERLFVAARLATVRAALEPAVFAEAFAAGRQMSLEGAFTTILAPGHVGDVHETILR